MLLMPTLSYTGRRSAGAGGDPTSTQWRLAFPGSLTPEWGPDTSTVAFHEIEMRGSTGGADQCNGGTASASTSGGGSGSLPASAFDNDTSTTLWWSSSIASIGTDGWLQYTFPSAVTVREIWMKFYGWGNAPLRIDVQYYNGSSWVTWWTVDLTEYYGGSLTQTFNKDDTPSFSVSPTISTASGFYGEGDIATVSFTHNGTQTRTTYQWTRDGSPISGATARTYTYVSADVGHNVGCTVTAANGRNSVSASTPTNAISTPAFSTGNHRIVGSDNRIVGTDQRVVSIRTA